MNKQTVIGLVIISAIFVGYMVISNYMQKDEKANNNQTITNQINDVDKKINDIYQDTLSKISDEPITQNEDSVKKSKFAEKYAIFSIADTTDKFFYVENNKMKIAFSNKGAKIYSVELKEYKTFDSLPLIMFENNENTEFGIDLFVNGKTVLTNGLYFSSKMKENAVVSALNDTVVVSMALKASDDKYLEFQYIIPPDDYLIDFNINFVGLEQELQNTSDVLFTWNSDIPALEKGRKWESENTMVTLRLSNEDIEEVVQEAEKDGGDPSFETSGNVNWIAFKQQFFSSILVSKNNDFNSPTINIYNFEDENSKFIKRFESSLSFNINHQNSESHNFSYYFGPNKFSVLKEYEDANGEDLDFETLVPLGWGIFGWVNRFLIIPIFNFLGTFIQNYGLIIFLLTLIIKIILFPFTYKSYLSTAKMKVLKPDIDEITKKFKPEQKMEAQQATMAYYKKAGVSPMGGCLPMLLQFPILIAMFRFFPASIELRQQSFLWADDLSAYDSILQLPFNIPFYGDHISLFALLMALSMVFSTLLTQNQQPTNNAMPGMKVMMYLMPVMMLVWFNNYSAGLSYYYLLANIITILQTLIIRKFFVNEKKLKAKIDANAQKVKPKSRWQQRMEEVMKAQQQQQKQRRN